MNPVRARKSSNALSLVALTAGTALAAIALTRLAPAKTGSRIVVVTGGSRGLGFAIAERFALSGDKLVLCSRKLDELEEAREKLVQSGAVLTADDVLLVEADLTDPAAARELVDRALARFGRIDVLVNNAGIIQVGPFENQPLSAFHKTMDTNFFAALHCIQAALPHMLAQAAIRKDSRQRAKIAPLSPGPVIVNIASIGGKMAVPHMLPYTAAKFALVGLSEGLHAELRGKGVHVLTVCPGLMRTGGEAHAEFVGNKTKEQRWFNIAAKTPGVATTARHAANRVFSAVAARRAEITITPQAYLAARAVGLAPGLLQGANALMNDWVLPAPTEE